MNIQPHLDSATASISIANKTEKQQANIKLKNADKTINNQLTDEVSISSLGSINQKIDSLFTQADAIYQSHITPNQQKALNESYTKLDELFSNSSPSDHQQKNADILFSKIEQIFTQAEKQLTSSEKEQLAVIDSQLDELLGKEDMQLEYIFNEDVEKLFQQSEDLLTSKLSAEQKKSLDDLNNQLNSLFEKSNVEDETVDKLFDKIDNILNISFDKLSSNEKYKFDNYNQEIDELFKLREQQEIESDFP